MVAVPFHAPFEIVREADGDTVRFPSGTSLTGTLIEALTRRLSLVNTSDRCPSVTLDLGSVATLDSAALGKLLAFHRTLHAAKGRLTLANLGPDLRRVLRLTRLDTVLNVRAAPVPI